MPLHIPGFDGLPAPDDRAWLDHMPGSTVPVIRQPYRAGDLVPFWVGNAPVDRHELYDLTVDPDEQENRTGGRDEAEMIELLREALGTVDAPDEQFERLGVA